MHILHRTLDLAFRCLFTQVLEEEKQRNTEKLVQVSDAPSQQQLLLIFSAWPFIFFPQNTHKSYF